MVREHYAQLGFSPLSETADGVTRWALSLDTPLTAPDFIRIIEG
jgi:hypothetical protein